MPSPDAADVEAFLGAARAIAGAGQVLTDAAATGPFAEDWSHRWVGTTPAVLRPGSTQEVAELVRAARQHRVALVPQGGNTGLVGGSVPHAHEVVLNLRRLDHLGPVDRLAGQVTAGAGTLLVTLQERAAEAGLAFGVDLAARGSATVGGMVATNAGGMHVLRFGAMRSQVVGVEAVLGDGRVVRRLSGLVKDNTGYDLAQLLCGSEGTLGVVTRVRLRLVPAARELVVALLALPSTAAAVALAAELRWRVDGVMALELMVGTGLRAVADHLGISPPLQADAEAFLLVELEAADDPTERLAAAIDAVTGEVGGQGAGSAWPGGAGPRDTAVATAEADRARLWRLREEHSGAAVAMARTRGGVVHKLDVTLPLGELARFCDEVEVALERRWPGALTLVYGHVGDGNVHVNVIPPPGADSTGDEVDDVVLSLVVARGGSISAEHGIGVAKKRWLSRDRSPAEVAAMRAVKTALDPDGILNPNVLLP